MIKYFIFLKNEFKRITSQRIYKWSIHISYHPSEHGEMSLQIQYYIRYCTCSVEASMGVNSQV